MSVGKRITSFILSMAMLAGNMVSPMTAYADEAYTETGQTQAESPTGDVQMPAGQSDSNTGWSDSSGAGEADSASAETTRQTEAPNFRLVLPEDDALDLVYDQAHFSSVEKNSDGSVKDTILLFKAGEEVTLDVTATNSYAIDKIQFVDRENVNPESDKLNVDYKEYQYTWKDEDTLVFQMPDNDIWMRADTHQIQTETAVQTDAAVTGEEASSSVTGAAENASDDTSVRDEAAVQSGDASSDSTDPSNDAQDSGASGETPDTSSVIESDGFPSQGAVIKLDEITIGIDRTELDPAEKFADVIYPQDTCRSTLISSEVKFGTPGLYPVVYRVNESTTGKDWYVVQPVRVSEAREAETQSEASYSTETQSTADDGASGQDESDGESADDSDVPPASETVETEIVAPETETEFISIASELQDSEGQTEADTEAETEAETSAETYQVILKSGSDLNVVLDHKDGYYHAGEKVVIKSDLSASQTDIAAWKTVNNGTNDTGDYCEVTYDAADNSNSFIMPEENVELTVSAIGSADMAVNDVDKTSSADTFAQKAVARALSAVNTDDTVKENSIDAAATESADNSVNESKAVITANDSDKTKAEDDNDGSWDDQTDVEAGSYYYHSDGKLHPFSSSLGSGGNDSYKWVRYKVDGKTYDNMAYCMQHQMHSPASGTTYKTMLELDESGDDKYLRKAMFYGYGGPGWGGTFNGYSLKAIFTKYGCTTETRAMQHYLLDYLYDGSSGFGGALSQKGKNMLIECKNALAKMPDPTTMELLPSTSVTATSRTSPTFTWKANEAFKITVHLENGVSLVNETTGKTSTGNVTVAGGQKFHLLATAADTSKLSGKYDITSNYPLNFHAMLLKLQSAQDIGFGYYTTTSKVSLSVDWPTTQPVSVKKVSSDPDKTKSNPNYSFKGATFVLKNSTNSYTFVCKEDGSSDAQNVEIGTYTLSETVTPAGFKPMTPATKSITVDKAMTIEIADEPDDHSVSVKKVSTDPATTTSNSNYSFKGAQFTLTGYGKTYTFTCEADGTSNTVQVPLGTYTLQETNTPTGFKPMRPATKTINVDKDMTIEVADEPQTRPVKVKKVSSNTDVTANNGMYSFEGAKFTLTGYGHTYEFTCKADGTSNEVQVPLGTYTLSETKTPAGYKPMNPATQTVTVDSDKTITVSDEPITATLSTLLQKVHDGYATNAPMAGAQFAVKYYDSTSVNGDPTRTWYIETKEEKAADGSSVYTTKLDSAHLISGKQNSKLYADNVLPLGFVTVEEIQAPTGYERNTGVFSMKITQSGDRAVITSTSDRGSTASFNQTPTKELFDVQETPTFGDLKIKKQEADLGATPSGDATLERAVYEIVNESGYDVCTKTEPKKAYKDGEVVTTITTDKNGVAQTTGQLLQVGKYLVREKDPSEGMTKSDREFHLSVPDKNTADYTVDPDLEKVIRAGFKIRKTDLELQDGKCTLTDKTSATFRADKITKDGNKIQGEASLKDATFDLINRSADPIAIYKDVNGNKINKTIIQPGQKVGTFRTDENGNYQSAADFLPYGTYEIIETAASEGYNLRGKHLDETFTIRKADADKVKDLTSISAEDDVIRFDIDIHKVESELNEEDPHDKLTPMEGIQFDIYLDADMNGDKPKDGAKPYVSIATNSQGYATTESKDYPHGRLPYGHYTIIENASTVPTGFGAIRNLHVDGTKTGGVYDGQLIQTGIYQDQHGAWIQLAKIDQDSLKPVLRAGAEFKILKSDRNTVVKLKDSTNHKIVDTFVTNDKGIAYLPQKLEVGTYYLVETKAPYGYLLNSDPVEFKVDTANTWDQLITWSKEDKEVKGIVTITKADAETKKKIAGARFGIYADEDIISGDGTLQAKKGTQVDTVVIGSDGTGKSRELYLGKYHAAEIQAPSGYTLDPTNFPVTLTYKDEKTPIVYAHIDSTNKPTTVKFTKYEWATDKNGEWSDDATTKTLSGITFTIMKVGGEKDNRYSNGNIYLGGTEVTGNDGVVLKKYVASGIYAITEKKTLPGYVLDTTPTYFTVDRDGYVFMSDAKGNPLDGQTKSDKAETIRKNQYTRWDFGKTDVAGNEIAGAQMQVLDSRGNVAEYVDDSGKTRKAQWTSDGKPHRITRLPIGKYILHEEQAAEGYTIAVDLPFTVTNTGVLCTKTMIDKKLTLQKTDAFGKGVKGAELELYEVHIHETTGKEYLSKEPVITWKSDGNKVETTGLYVGQKYRLVEVKAPDGYIAADPIEFTIENDFKDQNEVLTDEQVLVLKVNTGIKAVAGAHLQVRDSENKIVDDWTSDGSKHAVSGLKLNQEYTLIEVKAPEGYVQAAPIRFTTTKDFFAPKTINMVDAQVKVSKTDVTGKAEVEGAKLTVSDTSTGKIVDSWTSGKDVHNVSGLTVSGSYILHEEAASVGYVKASDIPFTLTEDGRVKETDSDTVTMVDKQVLMTKKTVTGQDELEGAKLTVAEQETGVIADSWTSGKQPHAISGLEVGKTYVLTETTAPEGYAVAKSIVFAVPDDGKNQEIAMIDKQVFVTKTDITGSDELPGAELTVIDKESGKPVDSWVSTDKPHAVNNLEAGKTYILREVTAPDGYAVAEEIEFTVNDDGADQTVTMKDKQVFVTKTDVTGEKEIPGAKLTVTDKETGKAVDSWTSTDKQHPVNGLEVGKTYILTEVTAPDGYAVAESIEFTVENNDQNQTVIMMDKRVTVDKLDVTGKPVTGAKLAVYELVETKTQNDNAESGTSQEGTSQDAGENSPSTESPSESEVVTGTVVNSTDDSMTSGDAVLVGVGSDGSVVSGTVASGIAALTTDSSEKTQSVENPADASDSDSAAKEISGVSAVEKQSESDKNSESGKSTEAGNETGAVPAVDTSKMATGKLIDTWTTDGRSHAVNGLIVGHSYRIIEESTPDGYATANYKDFTVTKEFVDQYLTLIDRQVLVSKVNTGIVMVAGAQLEVRDKNGKVIDNWTSDGTAHAVSGLVVGETYTLVETKAPEGYVLAAPIEFTVSDKADANDELSLINKQVKITKTDITGKEEIEGAHLEVREKKTNKTVDSWTSTKEAHPVSGLEVGKTYVLTETKPADGYVTAESIEFTVEDNFKDEEHTMKDDVTKIDISKQDITSGKELPGAQLTVKDKDGNVIESWTSTNEAHHIEKLPIGTYTLTEVAPPSLYMKAEDVEFEVKDTGEIQKVVMKDAPTQVLIHKKDFTEGAAGKELPGAKLEVRNESGTVVDFWTSGTEAHALTYLPAGTYTLTEMTAPSGYEVAENVTFSITDNATTQEVTMYDVPKENKIDLTGKKTTTGGGSTPSGGSTGGGTVAYTSPVKTGDTNNITLYMIMLGLVAGAVVYLLRKKMKQARD